MAEIVLIGQGANLVLNLAEELDPQRFVMYRMRIGFHAGLEVQNPETAPSGIQLKEVERLASYVRAHFGTDSRHMIESSDLFMSLECGVQLKCLEGEQ